MAKKKEEIIEEAIETKEEGIAPLTENFNREDLNQLRDKINELIARG